MNRTIKPIPELADKVLTTDEARAEFEGREPPKPEGPKEPEQTSDKDFLLLENIECVDAIGNVIEQHDRLYVAKDVVMNELMDDVMCPTLLRDREDALDYCKRKGMHLPSLALLCNILVKLYERAVEKQEDGSYKTLDEEAKRILDFYERGATLTGSRLTKEPDKIVHNIPDESNIPGAPYWLDYSETRPSITTSEINTNQALLRNLQNLTGLQDPTKLDEIASYFDAKFSIEQNMRRTDTQIIIAGKSEHFLIKEMWMEGRFELRTCMTEEQMRKYKEKNER